VFPNITIALHILVSLPASVVSGEHSLLKQVKNYYFSTVGQDHFNGFAMLSINCDHA
jgi:hypothetical protein